MDEKKPRWEVKYEGFVEKESSIKIDRAAKREDAKLLRDQINKLEGQTANPDGSIDFVKLTKMKTQLAGIETSLSTDLKDFENYEKNKTQLKNIYEYKKELVGRVKEIEDKYIRQNSETQERRSKLEDKKNEIEKAKANIEKQEEQIDSMLKMINSMPDGEERTTNTSKLQKVTAANMKAKQKLEKMQQEYTIEDNQFMTDVSKNRQAAHKDEELLDKYKRRITKCNIIGANLMKGKDLKDIDLDEKQEKTTSKVENAEQTRTESAPENNAPVNPEQTEAPTQEEVAQETAETEAPTQEEVAQETAETEVPAQDENEQESSRPEDDIIRAIKEQDEKQFKKGQQDQNKMKSDASNLFDRISQYISEDQVENENANNNNPSRDPEYSGSENNAVEPKEAKDSKLEKKILFAIKHPHLARIGQFFRRLFRRENKELDSAITKIREEENEKDGHTSMTQEEFDEQFNNNPSKDKEKQDEVSQDEVEKLLKKYMPEFQDKSEENREETEVKADVTLEGETKKEEFMKSLDARDSADNTTTEVKKMSENDLLKAIAEKGSQKVFTEMVEQNKAAANVRNAAKDQAWANRKQNVPEQEEK